MYEIRFPHLGIDLKNVIDGITIGGFEIRFYGIIIAIGFILAYILISNEAKRTNQNPETYLDFMLWLVIPAILGARLYYIIFSWKDYVKEGQSIKETIFNMINIRGGGLAIYGGVIAGIIVLLIFAAEFRFDRFAVPDFSSLSGYAAFLKYVDPAFYNSALLELDQRTRRKLIKTVFQEYPFSPEIFAHLREMYFRDYGLFDTFKSDWPKQNTLQLDMQEELP